ncbi:MAG: hypothetical protein ACREDS_03315 [Limisphaerales bacterium]
MKRCYFIAVLISLVVCGCESRNNERIPVTVLPSSSDETAQRKDEQHLQGVSLYADRQAALSMNARLNEVPECSDYIQEILSNLNESAYTNCPVGTTFYLGMEIYRDGSIGDVAVGGWTNAVSTPLFIRDIKQSHFPKWPDAMHSIVGHDYFIMWIDTGNPYPPAPD